MRKLAPVFVLTSFVAFSSACVFAMGDMNKKKSTTVETSTQSNMSAPPLNTTGSSYNSGSTGSNMSGSGTSSSSSMGSPMMRDSTPTPMGDTGTSATKAKRSQNARNDDRCDESRNPGMTLPKDCSPTAGTGAPASSGTTGQSGGQ